MELATKLTKYNISVPQYVEAMMETDVPSLGSRPPPFSARLNYAHA